MEERSSVALGATVFVIVFAAMFGSLLFALLTAFVIDFVRLGDVSWDEWTRRLTRMADTAFLPSVVFAFVAAVMFLAAVRWRHVLMPEPTEAERTRPLSIAVVTVCVVLIAMAVASVAAVASSLLQIPLEGSVAIAVSGYSDTVEAIAGAFSPARFIDAANKFLGLGLGLDPLWPHVVVVYAGCMAQLALGSELFPISKMGRASFRRLRALFVFSVLLLSAAIVLKAGLTVIVVTLVMPLFSTLMGAFDVARKGDAESRHRLFYSAVQLVVPALAAIAILAGRNDQDRAEGLLARLVARDAGVSVTIAPAARLVRLVI